MKCHILEIPKSNLEALPDEEVAFLMIILHFANEINILHKSAIASKPDELPDPILNSAQNCQVLFFLRILAGKLYEAWRSIETRYFAAKLSLKYDQLLPQSSREALARLKKYFSNSNNVAKDIRHKYAFHTDFDRIQDGLKNLPDYEPLKIVVTNSLGNVYSQFAETVTNWSVLNAINTETIDEAIKKLMNEILLTLPVDFLHFAHGFAGVALEQCDYTSIEHELNGVTNIGLANLPYFAEHEE